MNFKNILASFSFGLFLAAHSAAAHGFTVEIGPIWGNDHANQVCPAACTASNGNWNGHWWTTVANEQSACSCDPQSNPAPGPSPDCKTRLICSAVVESWTCEDTKGRTAAGDNSCKPAERLRDVACRGGESFNFDAVKCTKHPLPFED